MKQILVEVDDRCARDLEKVAPVKERKRAEFIRLAIRRAIDLALDRATATAYSAQPLSDQLIAEDVLGWDDDNELARHTQTAKTRRMRQKARSA